MSLFKTAAKVGVATSVHGRVNRRQQNKWAAQDAPVAQVQQVVPVQHVVAAAPAGVDFDTKLAQLTQLGQLRDAGVLSEAEFEIKKAEILRQ